MPTGEQKQKKRTIHALPKPDNFIRYRHTLRRALHALRVGATHSPRPEVLLRSKSLEGHSRICRTHCPGGLARDTDLNQWEAVSWAARRSTSSFVPTAATMPASRDGL